MSISTAVGIVFTGMMIIIFLAALISGLSDSALRPSTRRNMVIYIMVILMETVVMYSLIAKG